MFSEDAYESSETCFDDAYAAFIDFAAEDDRRLALTMHMQRLLLRSGKRQETCFDDAYAGFGDLTTARATGNLLLAMFFFF